MSSSPRRSGSVARWSSRCCRPRWAAGVNLDRFQREIQLAARLQHPHIVPLLTAGASGDLLYYVMPFINGESLRVKLAREGRAARARERPDPARGSRRALVRPPQRRGPPRHQARQHPAVRRSRGRHGLRRGQGGERVERRVLRSRRSAWRSARRPTWRRSRRPRDPHVDHRADIYAVGALAYEMLAGRPPFTAPTAQALLAAQITQAPEPRGAATAARCRPASTRW